METIENLRSQPKYNYNPYVRVGNKALTLHKDSDAKIVSNPIKTFDICKDVRGIARVREVDNDKFVKIYTGHLGVWFELSVPAQKVLSYILNVLPRNSDMVRMSMDRLKGFTAYKSDTSIYDAINELCNRRIIARSKSTELYFINPGYIFNGDRIIFSEAILRNNQAIHERDVMITHSENGEEKAYVDELGQAVDADAVTMNDEDFLTRASRLYQ